MDGGLVTTIITVFAESPVLVLIVVAAAFAGCKAGYNVLRVWSRAGGGYNVEIVEK